MIATIVEALLCNLPFGIHLHLGYDSFQCMRFSGEELNVCTHCLTVSLCNTKIQILSSQNFEGVLILKVLFTASQGATPYVFAQMGAELGIFFTWLAFHYQAV